MVIHLKYCCVHGFAEIERQTQRCDKCGCIRLHPYPYFQGLYHQFYQDKAFLAWDRMRSLPLLMHITCGRTSAHSQRQADLAGLLGTPCHNLPTTNKALWGHRKWMGHFCGLLRIQLLAINGLSITSNGSSRRLR